MAKVCGICHKQETGPLHECEVQLDAGQAAAKAAAAPVDKASEEYMASIGKRCDLIALLVTVHADVCVHGAAQVPCVRRIHLKDRRLRLHDVWHHCPRLYRRSSSEGGLRSPVYALYAQANPDNQLRQAGVK